MQKITASTREKGQSLVIIALAIVVIFGFAALAVDVGRLYLTRRNAQAAADSAALNATYALCNGEDWVAAAYNMAELNGFTDSAGTTGDVIINVNNPPMEGPYIGRNDYLEVTIYAKNPSIFAGFVYNGELENTVRAVGRCVQGFQGYSYGPAVDGEVAILALNPTASKAFSNTGGAEVIVDGGVFVNSDADDALFQNGSATLKMNWAKVRGGAEVGGAFGINLDGSGAMAQQIDIVKDFHTSGSGKSIAGAFNIGGSVINSASVNMTGFPIKVGGNFDNSGAATVVSPQLVIAGDVINKAGGTFTSETMVIGGDYTANGAAWARPALGKKMNLAIGGNINLSGSASLGTRAEDNVVVQGTVKTSGGAAIKGTLTHAPISKPTFSVTIPQKDDPLVDILFPPEGPEGNCTHLSIPNYGAYTPALISGGYYCNFDFNGSVSATISPGTYWVDYFSLGGAATLKMDGVQLYVTGKKKKTSFDVGGSGSLSMLGTMVYLKSGAFSFSGAGGTFDWTAPGPGQPYEGLSLYLDRDNSSTASVVGSAYISDMSGTWYAPGSACKFVGATETTIYSQFICDTVEVNGSANLTIRYDADKVYQISEPSIQPQVTLAE